MSLGCADESEGSENAFTSFTTSPTTTDPTTGGETGTTNDSSVPPDMPATTTTGDGDGDPSGGDGDGDMTTTTTTTTTGDGDGDDPTTTGGAICGNGVIDQGEQCDGGNLGGFTCVDLGYSGGTLACDPVNCTYDASGCVNDMEGGGSGTTG